MQRIFLSTLVLMAVLMSGVTVHQFNRVDTAYALLGDGDGDGSDSGDSAAGGNAAGAAGDAGTVGIGE